MFVRPARCHIFVAFCYHVVLRKETKVTKVLTQYRVVQPDQQVVMTFRAILSLSWAIALAASAGCGGARQGEAESAPGQSGIELAREGEPAVELVIDYGDGVEKRLPISPAFYPFTADIILQFLHSEILNCENTSRRIYWPNLVPEIVNYDTFFSARNFLRPCLTCL